MSKLGQTFGEPWHGSKEGLVFDVREKSIMFPGSPGETMSSEWLAYRAAVCVNALRGLHSDTIKRSTFYVKTGKDSVLLASDADDMLAWCKDVLEDAGYKVEEPT